MSLTPKCFVLRDLEQMAAGSKPGAHIHQHDTLIRTLSRMADRGTSQMTLESSLAHTMVCFPPPGRTYTVRSSAVDTCSLHQSIA